MSNFGKTIGGAMLTLGLATNPGIAEAKKKTNPPPVSIVIAERCTTIMGGIEGDVACEYMRGRDGNCESEKNVNRAKMIRCERLDPEGNKLGYVYRIHS